MTVANKSIIWEIYSRTFITSRPSIFSKLSMHVTIALGFAFQRSNSSNSTGKRQHHHYEHKQKNIEISNRRTTTENRINRIWQFHTTKVYKNWHHVVQMWQLQCYNHQTNVPTSHTRPSTNSPHYVGYYSFTTNHTRPLTRSPQYVGYYSFTTSHTRPSPGSPH